MTPTSSAPSAITPVSRLHQPIADAAPGNVTQDYDIIGYGDEVPGVLALVAAAREYRARAGKPARVLLLTAGDTSYGVGGHLIRGQLCYLDRTHLAPSLRERHGMGLYGDPAAIYQEFLQRAGVVEVGLDWRRGDRALREMLSEAGVQIVDRAKMTQAVKEGNRLVAIRTDDGDTFRAKQFIDSTVNAWLLQAAGGGKVAGFGTLGLPNAALPVSLIFETQSLTVDFLRRAEASWIQRFCNPSDTQAQQYLNIAAGGDPRRVQWFTSRMRNAAGQPMTMIVGPDYIDVRCHVLSILYHAYRGTSWDLEKTKFILDSPNIAVLPGGRLSWNALLCFVTAPEAEALARNAGLPTERMKQEVEQVARWMKGFGQQITVTPAHELYIRYAGGMTDPINPLPGAQMLAGGVPATEALGTFGYKFDVRGGIPGLGQKAIDKGFKSLQFLSEPVPVFNFGIRHAISKTVPNLAVVSPASGYFGIAPAAGRIVELNVGVGQGLGVAAAIALHQNRTLADVTNLEVRQTLKNRGKLTKVYGLGQTYVKEFASFEKTLFPKELPLPDGQAIESPPIDDWSMHWAASFIKILRDRKVIGGYDDGSFRPDGAVRRAEFAAIVGRAFELPLRRPARAFGDVPASYWGYGAIQKAVQMGFLSGYEGDQFLPAAQMRRCDALVALVSGLGLPAGDPKLLAIYGDRSDIPDYAEQAIAAATERRMVVNHPQVRQLRPTDPLTRAELAALVHQALAARGAIGAIDSPYIVQPVDPSILPLFADLEGHWARSFVEAAAIEGWVSGYKDGNFRPHDSMTRAQFAVLVTAALNPQPRRPAIAFRDVPRGHWAERAIQRAQASEFVSGISADRFDPDGLLNRVQVVVALASGLNWAAEPVALLDRLDDRGQIPTWAQPRVAAALRRRAIVNYPNSQRFEGSRPATRAEVVAMVYQALVAEGRVKPIRSDAITQGATSPVAS
ncbi:MAG: FAD-dependent oxidoreductase [Oscillatoriales cyanobacterium]|nr:MAG: FAD-dependent oxidoreductase [Oscillatoriales cyanobacterium]